MPVRAEIRCVMSDPAPPGEAVLPVPWLSGLSSALGAWLVVSPFAVGSPVVGVGVWNNVLIGITIFVVGGYNYYCMVSRSRVSVGKLVLVALLGIWIVVASVIVFPVEDGLFTSNVLTGLLVAATSGYNAYSGRRAEGPMAETT